MNKRILFVVLMCGISLLSAISDQSLYNHTQHQDQFLALQKAAGMPDTPENVVDEVLSVGYQSATQDQFNAARGNLITLFSPILAGQRLPAATIAAIQQGIAAFQALNPARWPQPDEFANLLNIVLAKQAAQDAAAGQAQVAAQAAAAAQAVAAARAVQATSTPATAAQAAATVTQTTTQAQAANQALAAQQAAAQDAANRAKAAQERANLRLQGQAKRAPKSAISLKARLKQKGFGK